MGIGTLTFFFVTLMCGRTVVSLAPDNMIRACTFRNRNGKRKRPVWKDAPGGQQYRTSYNMAPGSFSPVLVASDHFEDKEDDTLSDSAERVLTPMKWGLIPPWHQGDPFKVPYETNNCRVEGMLEKKTYKVPLHRGNRCVILIDGFYEWKTTKEGKQPYFFHFPYENTTSEEPSKWKISKSESSLTATNIKMENFENNHPCIKKEKCMVKADDDVFLLQAMENEKFIKYESLETSFESSSKVKNLSSLTSEWENHESMKKCPSILDEMIEQKKEGQGSESSSQSQISDKASSSDQVCISHDSGNLENSNWLGPRVLTIAGVYDIWRATKTSEPIYSYSVITVPASKDMDWCHHRMPAISNQISSQLHVKYTEMQPFYRHTCSSILTRSSSAYSQAAKLIKPQVCLTSHPVSKKVNYSRYQAPDCVKPVDISLESKPKMTGSSNMMMNWLNKGPRESTSQTSPIKKAKIGS